MAASCPVGKKITATPLETDALGNQFPVNPADIAWTVADNTIASFVQNSDGSATFTPLKAGSTQVTVADSGNNLNASDTLTVTDTPTGLTIQWGQPQ